MQEKINIESMRHFKDLDDLSSGKRDGEIVEGQEELAKKYAKDLISRMDLAGKKGVLFITSSKRRCSQTADLISVNLKELNPKAKIKIVTSQELNSLDEGVVIIPKNYKKGDKFEGFPLAANAMLKEAHSTDFGEEEDNYLSRYGDPLLQDNGSYKYPELAKYFETSGESYRDFLLRVFGIVKETAQKVEKFGKNIEVVIICHAQVTHVLKDLQSISEKVKQGELKMERGELPRMCWQEFLERYKNRKVNIPEEDVARSYTSILDISNLLDPKLVQTLEQEIAFLKELQ